LKEVLTEEEQFRIDHYLGKEMVQNLLVLRFSNSVLESLWNRHRVKSVMITFKEDFGTQGRGGYFDDVGIIRDVIQNHLLQVLTLVAMERPKTLDAEDIRDEKVRVLKAIAPVELKNTVLGQYVGNDKEPGYADDETVPEGSNCATFATVVLHIDNERWKGVPFIIKCGKGLDEKKSEIRMQYREPEGQLFPVAPPNELVIRISPNESTYMKISVKAPGLSMGLTQSELDLHYPTRFKNIRLPEAYERLIFDVLKGDQSQFVRADELDEAWRIFTPMLHEIEEKNIVPRKYVFGSRSGPEESDELVRSYGVVHTPGYEWNDPRNRL